MLSGDCAEHISELSHLREEEAGVFAYQIPSFIASGLLPRGRNDQAAQGLCFAARESLETDGPRH